MQNPILAMLNQNNPQLQKLNQIKQLLAGKNPDAIYEEMKRTNPQFNKFVNDVQGKTIEDIAMEYDLDVNLLKKFL